MKNLKAAKIEKAAKPCLYSEKCLRPRHPSSEPCRSAEPKYRVEWMHNGNWRMDERDGLPTSLRDLTKEYAERRAEWIAKADLIQTRVVSEVR